MLAERITKKCIFEGVDGKYSPIKKVISHEIDITIEPEERKIWRRCNFENGEINKQFFTGFYQDLDSYIQATEECGEGMKCPVNSKPPEGWTIFESHGH